MPGHSALGWSSLLLTLIFFSVINRSLNIKKIRQSRKADYKNTHVQVQKCDLTLNYAVLLFQNGLVHTENFHCIMTMYLIYNGCFHLPRLSPFRVMCIFSFIFQRTYLLQRILKSISYLSIYICHVVFVVYAIKYYVYLS